MLKISANFPMVIDITSLEFSDSAYLGHDDEVEEIFKVLITMFGNIVWVCRSLQCHTQFGMVPVYCEALWSADVAVNALYK